MKLKNLRNKYSIKKIILIVVSIPVAIVVIFFLWIPLLILVCAFLLAAFILRKKVKIAYLNNFGKKDVYATWTGKTETSSQNKNRTNNDYYDAEYITIDDKEENGKERIEK